MKRVVDHSIEQSLEKFLHIGVFKNIHKNDKESAKHRIYFMLMVETRNKPAALQAWKDMHFLDQQQMLKSYPFPDYFHRMIINSGNGVLITAMCFGQKIKHNTVMKFKNRLGAFDKRLLALKNPLYKVLLNEPGPVEDT